MTAPHSNKAPDQPTAGYQRLHEKASNLEERSLYRRAAQVWRDGVGVAGLTEKERGQCARNAELCSVQAKYKGKSES